jgi:membrane protease YdiL (CAAX protease family)
MTIQQLSGETLTASSSRRLVAPVWHTTAIVLFFVGVSIAGAMFKQSTGMTRPAPAHGPLYISLIGAEIVLLLFVRLGLRKGRTPVSEILGRMDPSLTGWVRDAAIAALAWGLWIGIAIMGSRFTHSSPDISGLLPHGLLDGVLWIAVSASAAIAEELAFRGYLLRQFQAMTGNVWISLILQAAIFSIAHGYEGIVACANIAVLAILLGIVAIKTGNLRACMIAHAWTDVAAGLL